MGKPEAMSEEKDNSGGIGFLGVLTIVFITLKLTNRIDWSWWWVLSPLWIPVAAAVAIGIIVIVLKRIFP
jgi:ABC-type antimicrobial peptide transport system permease subunit